MLTSENGKCHRCSMQSCQVDLVKDGGHSYFIHFLESPGIHAEQRAMAAFVLTVVVDGYQHGQQACIQAGLINICLSHIQAAPNASDGLPEPLLLQWLCLCLGKVWDGAAEGICIALHEDAPAILEKILKEPHPEVTDDNCESSSFNQGTGLQVKWSLFCCLFVLLFRPLCRLLC